MSTKFISVKCPECDAPLEIEEGRTQAFCSYCGAKIKIENDNEYIYHNIDEAKIKQVEADHQFRMRELELNEKNQECARKGRKTAYTIAAVFAVIGIITIPIGVGIFPLLAAMLIAIYTYNAGEKAKKRQRILAPNQSQITEKMRACVGQNYTRALALYQSAGFENVSALPLCDLNIFTASKNGQVAEISINGISDFEEGDVFLKTDHVSILYHSK